MNLNDLQVEKLMMTNKNLTNPEEETNEIGASKKLDA